MDWTMTKESEYLREFYLIHKPCRVAVHGVFRRGRYDFYGNVHVCPACGCRIPSSYEEIEEIKKHDHRERVLCVIAKLLIVPAILFLCYLLD